MRNGGEARGNSRDRARRKQWMLDHFGDGTTVPCVFCGKALTFETVTADRIIAGGTYERANVQPACLRCNQSRGTKPMPPRIDDSMDCLTR